MREPRSLFPTQHWVPACNATNRRVVSGLDRLHLGADSSAWVYRLRTPDEKAYFVKVRRRVTKAASLLVPHALHARGITCVIAPLPNAAGALWTSMGDYVLILLRQIHAAVIASDLALQLGDRRYRVVR